MKKKKLEITAKLDDYTYQQLQKLLQQTKTSLNTLTETLLTATALTATTLAQQHKQYKKLGKKQAWQTLLIQAFDIYQLYSIQLIQPILKQLKATGHYILDDIYIQPVDEGCGYTPTFTALKTTPYLVDQFILQVPGCQNTPHLIAYHFLEERLEKLDQKKREKALDKLFDCIYNYDENCPQTELPIRGEDNYLELNDTTLEYHSEYWLESMPTIPEISRTFKTYLRYADILK